MLPAGSWSLSLSALFSPEAAEHEFAAEVWTERLLAEGTLRPHEGSAAIRLDFSLDETTEHPVAIRVSSRRAAFDGSIADVTARLVHATAALPEAPATRLALAGR